MNAKAEALKKRTKAFALAVLDFLETTPSTGPAARLANQLTDSATSVAANYRAACRARSRAEFAAKVGVALEESDETELWLELMDAKQWGSKEQRLRLLQEVDELTAIFVASSITARESLNRR
jgi:four helix bundle protein